MSSITAEQNINKLNLNSNEFTFEGVLFQGSYTQESVLEAKNIVSREEDLYLTTYPRTGTTWTQNILVGLIHGLDYLKGCDQDHLQRIFPYLEQVLINNEHGVRLANPLTSKPRFLKHHLPTHLCPQEIFTFKRKNLIVLRNPKATALSYWEFYKEWPFLRRFHENSTLEHFLDCFLAGEVLYGSWWHWTKNWVKKAREFPDNTLIIHYEDIHSNYEETVRRIANFVQIDPLSAEQMNELKKVTHVGQMKAKYFEGFVNKGEKDRWRNAIPKNYIEKFDELTKQTFEDNPDLMNKFI